MALFEGLPENTLMQRVIYWRTADVAGLPKAEKNHILRNAQNVCPQGNRKKAAMSVEELNQQTKNRIARRFAEAQSAVQKNSCN